MLVGAIAVAAGTAMWLGSRPASGPQVAATEISPAALFAATFADTRGAPASLGRFQGRVSGDESTNLGDVKQRLDSRRDSEQPETTAGGLAGGEDADQATQTG